MGMGATDISGRVASSLGKSGPASPEFQKSIDLPNGGVLFALPALIACGLFHEVEKYFGALDRGFYGLNSVFLIIAFMALSRIQSIEKLRYQSPGEWGKVVGLDRITEKKTLRGRIATLSQMNVMEWSADLSKKWLNEDQDNSSVLYIDGHVRVYHGHQTKLPRHHVARQKLCLRATCDYWVNGMDGQPFFKVNKAVDPGMIKTIEKDILPWIKTQIPKKTTDQELKTDPLLHTFTIIGDREIYSPLFMLQLKRQRIACQTYNKFPKENWDVAEFRKHTIELASGIKEEVMLAERGTFLLIKKSDLIDLPIDNTIDLVNPAKAEETTHRCGIWAREIRKINKSGGQTAVLSTNYKETKISRLASEMFARWLQENYFRYGRQQFGLDKLVNYKLEEIPEAEIVNPKYRKLEGEVKKTATLLSRRKAKFYEILLKKDIEEKHVAEYEKAKAESQEEIDQLEKKLEELKTERKSVPKRVQVKDLPEEEQFKQLSNHSKHLIDMIKVVAYRAESAMANIINEAMSRKCDARGLLVAIYKNEIDLIPDEKAETLTIKLHHLASHSESRAMEYLCKELTETETIFPGTNLRLIYKLVSSAAPNPAPVQPH